MADNLQDRRDAARRAAGIDGTAGDAQDIPHAYQPDGNHAWCLLCGLAPAHRKHTAAVSAPAHYCPACRTTTPATEATAEALVQAGVDHQAECTGGDDTEETR